MDNTLDENLEGNVDDWDGDDLEREAEDSDVLDQVPYPVDDATVDVGPTTGPATSVATSSSPQVMVDDAPGDVAIRGWDRMEVSVDRTHAEAPVLEVRDDGVHVRASDDLELRVPFGARLAVTSTGGDLAVDSVRGDVALGSVSGDLALRDVGSCSVGSVGGDLAADAVNGSLSVATVGGDLAARAVNGKTTIETVGGDLAASAVNGGLSVVTVGGDLAARDVSGEVLAETVGGDATVRDTQGSFKCARVGGSLRLTGVAGDVRAIVGSDARLSLTPAPGRSFAVTAGSSIRCGLPADADVDVNATSGAGIVHVNGTEGETQKVRGVYSTTMGAGGARLDLVAGSAIHLDVGVSGAGDSGWGDVGAEFTADLADWTDELASRMRVHASRMAERVSERLGRVAETMPDVLVAAGMSAKEAERIAERVQRAAERAGEQTQRAASHAERIALRAEHHAERAQRWAEHRAQRAARHADAPRETVSQGRRSAEGSDEERLMILRMVEQDKITVDDAERLLSALAGRQR